MQDGQAGGQPVVQTLARFGEHDRCQDLTADRGGNIYAAVRCDSVSKPFQLLQLKPGSNELVQLPVCLDEDLSSIAVSPSGQELFESADDGTILVHRAPWTDREGEVLSAGHDYCLLQYCDGDRYVLLLVHCHVALLSWLVHQLQALLLGRRG